MPYFCLYNNSIEHLLKTAQLNTKLESHLSLCLRPHLFFFFNGTHLCLLDLESSLRSKVPP